jgi:hypothetical protein
MSLALKYRNIESSVFVLAPFEVEWNVELETISHGSASEQIRSKSSEIATAVVMHIEIMARYRKLCNCIITLFLDGREPVFTLCEIVKSENPSHFEMVTKSFYSNNIGYS